MLLEEHSPHEDHLCQPYIIPHAQYRSLALLGEHAATAITSEQLPADFIANLTSRPHLTSVSMRSIGLITAGMYNLD